LKILTIDDRSAYIALSELEVKHGIRGGPSSGMVFAALKKELNNMEDGSSILVLSADSSWDYAEWNRAVLTKLKSESVFSKEDSMLVEKYMELLQRREGASRRVLKVKNIYKPSKKGQLYNLEEFEDLLPKLVK